MTWQRRGDRLLVLCEDGTETPWRIMKFGLEEPYKYELWGGDHFVGEFGSAQAAMDEQERIANDL